MPDKVEEYLDIFARKARAAGLDMAKPGKNWSAMRPIVRDSHISLSVRKDQIQVNLNNDKDADRARYSALYDDRSAIEHAIGMGLSWEKKSDIKKTVVRATLEEGYETPNWDEQHRWALKVMLAFVREFEPRLAHLG